MKKESFVMKMLIRLRIYKVNIGCAENIKINLKEYDPYVKTQKGEDKHVQV